MTGAVFGGELTVAREMDRLVVSAAAPGAAGMLGVEHAGLSVDVDAADPARLIDVALADPDPSAKTLDIIDWLFGSPRAGQLLEAPDGESITGADGATHAAAGFGQVLLRLAIAFEEDDSLPLERLAAAADALPIAGRLGAPTAFTDWVEDAAASVAAHLLDDDELIDAAELLAGQDPETAATLATATQGLLASCPAALQFRAQRLQRTLERNADDGRFQMVASMMDLEPAAPRIALDVVGGPVRSEVRIQRLGGGVREVIAPFGQARSWVRVFRSDGVTVALAPMQRRGRVAVAEVLVPPDLDDGDLGIAFTDPNELPPSGSPIALMIRAIEVGRTACGAERRGHLRRAAAAWSECADLWEALDDPYRAELARAAAHRIGQSTPRRPTPMLSDTVADVLHDAAR